jgi:hypothetical protein
MALGALAAVDGVSGYVARRCANILSGSSQTAVNGLYITMTKANPFRIGVGTSRQKIGTHQMHF